jgi:uncharacterized membrane protein
MASSVRSNLLRSLAYAMVLSIGAYALAWGLFTTHGELDVSSGTALSIAVWTFVVVLIGSMIRFAVRSADPRRK